MRISAASSNVLQDGWRFPHRAVRSGRAMSLDYNAEGIARSQLVTAIGF